MTTRTSTAALILTLIPALCPSLKASDDSQHEQAISSRSALPLVDDALDFATLDRVEFLPEPEPEPEPEPAPQPAYSGDPYGFAAFLNTYRASAGLPPVAYCPNLSAWASQNNSAQCLYGLGHHVMANFSQNSGFNQSSVFEIARQWMNSPGHARNMLTPTASRFGIAYGPGPYWTLNLQ